MYAWMESEDFVGACGTLVEIISVNVSEEETANLGKLTPEIDGFVATLEAAEAMLIRCDANGTIESTCTGMVDYVSIR